MLYSGARENPPLSRAEQSITHKAGGVELLPKLKVNDHPA
jgi:hypothetical protein